METRELTNSMRTKWSACHRAYKIAYVDRIRPVRKRLGRGRAELNVAFNHFLWAAHGYSCASADAAFDFDVRNPSCSAYWANSLICAL